MRERINNQALVAAALATGVHIVHVRPDLNGGLLRDQVRPCTIAFRERRSGLMEIAVAIVHTNDQFCRKIGTKTALESFNAGRTILFPVRRDLPVTQALRDRFCW